MTTLPSATPAKIFIFTFLEEEANMVFSSVSARKFYLRAKVAPEDLF